jgi:hypothetical protein
MKKFFYFFIILLALFSISLSQTSRFVKVIRTATGQLVTGLDVDLYYSGAGKAYDMGETVAGQYEHATVSHGQYDLYINGVSKQTNIWIGTDRISIIADDDHFNVSGELQNDGIEDSVITLSKFTTAAYNYIGSGGSITNNPDEITLENKSGFTLGIKSAYVIDSLTVADSTALIVMAGAEGRKIRMLSLVSGSPYGGGELVSTTTASYSKSPNGITIFANPTLGVNWVRSDILKRPAFIEGTWGGVIPDDAGSDVAAIQRCIDLADSGMTVLLPAGVLVIDASVVTTKSNITLLGSPAAIGWQPTTTTRHGENYSVLRVTANEIIALDFPYSGNVADRYSGPTIKNLAFEDKSDSLRTTYIRVGGKYRTHIENNSFGATHSGVGIWMDASSITNISCQILNNSFARVDTCIKQTGSGSNNAFHIRGNWFSYRRSWDYTATDGWVDATGNLYYVTGIPVDPSHVYINGSWGTGVASSALCNSHDEWFWTTAGDDTLFIYTVAAADTGNVFRGPMGSHGIYSEGLGNAVIISNQFDEFYTAVKITGDGNNVSCNNYDGCHIGTWFSGGSKQCFIAFNMGGADTMIVDESTSYDGNTYMMNHMFVTSQIRMDSSSHRFIGYKASNAPSANKGVIFSNGPTPGSLNEKSVDSNFESVWDFYGGARFSSKIALGPYLTSPWIDSTKVVGTNLQFHIGANIYNAAGSGAAANPHGGMYFSDSSVTIAMVKGDWEPMNNATTTLWTPDTLFGITFGSDRLEPTSSGVYTISGNLSFSGTSGDTVEIGYQNGAGMDTTHVAIGVIGSSIMTLSITKTIYLEAAADVKFKMKNVSNSNNVIIKSGSISMVEAE